MISSMRRLLLAVGFARLLVERLHQIEKWGIGLTRWKSHIMLRLKLGWNFNWPPISWADEHGNEEMPVRTSEILLSVDGPDPFLSKIADVACIGRFGYQSDKEG